MVIRRLFNIIGCTIAIASFCFISNPSAAQDSNTYLLRWAGEPGQRFEYRLSTSATHGDSIAVRTETFTVEVTDKIGDEIHFIATGETVPDTAPLSLRFQRALFTDFPYTINTLGVTVAPLGQPFPPFLNVPAFQEGDVAIGATWSGGPVGILPDANAGAIPFSYESTFTEVTNYLGEQCAVIETRYTLALPDGERSMMPFIGIVEGDQPEEPGSGAVVGGVVEGSRANLAGIQPGDIIIKAESQRIRGWGGLQEILPLLVPEKDVDITLVRDGQTMEIPVTPEAVPLAFITGSGGLISTCYFSLEKGVPLKVELTSAGLVFTLTNSAGEIETRDAPIHIVMEYLSSPGPVVE
jgi:hypothetical protein